jgi:FkbM family methyltransferase
MNYELLKQHINPEPKRVLDIGAHRGDFTRLCRNQFPSAYFYLIEAEQEHEYMIKNENYKIAFLSDTSEEKIFYKSKFLVGNSGDSFYRENTHFYRDDAIIRETVQTTTLDEIFTNGETFDFIKIDTQGSELDILRGGTNTIRDAGAFLLEVSVFEYNLGGPQKEEVVKFMSDIGFPKQVIINEIFNPFNDGQQLIQQDILFLK